MSKCSIPPTDIDATYSKAGRIYADKIIALNFNDTMESVLRHSKNSSINDHEDLFIENMLTSALTPNKSPEQTSFYDKIVTGLTQKFPDFNFLNTINDHFVPSMRNRFSEYFQSNKKAIAKQIVDKRKKHLSDKISQANPNEFIKAYTKNKNIKPILDVSSNQLKNSLLKKALSIASQKKQSGPVSHGDIVAYITSTPDPSVTLEILSTWTKSDLKKEINANINKLTSDNEPSQDDRNDLEWTIPFHFDIMENWNISSAVKKYSDDQWNQLEQQVSSTAKSMSFSERLSYLRLRNRNNPFPSLNRRRQNPHKTR